MAALLLLCFADWPVIDAPAFPPERQHAALAATVRILRAGGVGAGSGVAVGRKGEDTYLLTACHMIDDTPEFEIQSFTAAKYPEPTRRAKSGRVVARWKDIDLALLSVSSELGPAGTLPIAPRDPNREQFAGLTVGCGNNVPPTCLAVRVRGKKLVARPDGVNRFFWEMAETSALGRSGGPLIDGQGRLVGICSANQAEKGYLTHLDEIRAALKKAGHDWLLQENSAR